MTQTAASLPQLATTVTGSGEPVVVLHGFTGSAEAMRPLIERLDRWRCVAVDLLGHGRSPSPPEGALYSVEAAAQMVASVTAAMPCGPCHIVGYSMGGRVALALATAHPQLCRSLTLISATAGIADEHERAERRAADARLAERIGERGIDWFVDYWTALPMWRSLRANFSPADWDASLRQRRRCHPTGLANCLRHGGTGSMPPLWDQLATITVPTLLLCGALDAKFVTIGHQMHELLSHSALAVMADAGHAVHLESPEECARAIRRHLAANSSS
ncbi:2-succinyl-6-hydroxy-2,4-cyclohexadiene-1-carboxylate synthase [Candidatus Poriferisodalis sp.]|uniref:2-succinyl-6-hydroxy-2, 4-cyclohexadiene-1-carboxylate synthase n=1 Tax=Candidatus Poriferisodalis sp. TaxID=3101277 RepID=UPI003B014EF0